MPQVQDLLQEEEETKTPITNLPRRNFLLKVLGAIGYYSCSCIMHQIFNWCGCRQPIGTHWRV